MSGPVKFHDPKQLYGGALVTPTRPDRTLLAIMLLAVVSLAGTLALLPGTEEKAEGLLAEGRYADAINTLVAVEDERPLNGYEGYMLFKLYMLAREPDNAAMLIAQQPALQVENTEALRQLADLYRQLGNMPGEAVTLRQIYDGNPNDADFSRLRVLYRLTGDAAGEASLLTRAIAAGRTDEASLQRLAYLQDLSPTDVRAALWVAPTGNFWRFEAALPAQIFALTNLSPATLTKTSIE
ncbi:hypothetical protein ASD83_11400 [Devosia sp. Root685]|uniref:tetratricopeptide repeat protein n=1 Tax=Devosia sp. Root685 TaxID=1736587 RepID=UPI0006FDF271|nr:hypothetical protein [Devosia sp. Root685]KRA97695.1 hypothetical protein ASD83_11400 [Devosia sp. Root685]